ncbi:transglutaminase family protein [Spirosoma fluviale]|uniref:Transglutaminase-like enzyme, putative cysteine protease n=1 Tax=Spirosoma fluviale TaxID=1597977 RepID=A0A286F9I4_9BACT|nr:transglutaminase family protein [Spirosoma fluviale]SOD79746.1 Transglutaminase-like enzyme, putative cysteine protease [Spirosoma fluviale]
MNLHVRHTSEYTYDIPVALSPQTLYLYPRTYPYQRLLQYELSIDPQPSRIVRNVDVEGNVQQVVYFNHPTSHLRVTAEMELQSDEFNSFDFVLFPFETQRVPFQYPKAVDDLLQPYLKRVGVSEKVESWARQLAADADGQTTAFLILLNQTIRQFTYEIRELGAPLPPEQTLTLRKGSCRDYTTLFMAACRSMGLAARFVSGYLFGNPQQEHQLHAWVEVYLPGAGWRGFDPTQGSLVVNRHIFLTSTAKPELAAPISGTFQGHANSKLRAELLFI